MNQTINSILIPNACRDVIGIKGVCSDTYAYYLDSLGISLSKAAKLADSSKQTAKELVDEAVEEAWGHVFGDLKIQGFMVQGVSHVYRQEFTDELVDVGTHTVSLTRACEFEQFYFNKVKLKVVGEVNVNLVIQYDGQETELYNGDLEDETLTVTIDGEFPYEDITLSLTATGTGQFYSTGESSPIYYDAYRECSEKEFYCKYHKYLTQAVMYKAAALILNNSLFNDRYNDIIAYNKGEIAIRVSQLDSSLNLLNTENRINKYGLYQQEIDKINDKLKLVVSRDCMCKSCCFECNEYVTTKMTIP